MYCAQLPPFGVGQVEGRPPVHEHQVVVEQPRVGDVEQFLADVGADFQFAAGGVHQVDDRSGRGVAAAGVSQRGDVQPAALDPIARPAGGRLLEEAFLCLQFAIGGVGQHVDAQRQGGVDLGLHDGAILLPAARPRQFPQTRQRRPRVARRVGRDVDHAGAAAELDAPQRPQLIGRNLLLGVPDRMLRLQQLQFVLRLGKHLLASVRGSRRRSSVEPQFASASRNPPRSR